MNINEILSQYAQYKAIERDAKNILKSLENDLREEMSRQGVDRLQGLEHCASVSTYSRTDVDTKTLAKDFPGIYNTLATSKEVSRFNFN